MDKPLWGLRVQAPFGVHSEHDLKEQSDAQIIVSRFPFRGSGSKGSKGSEGCGLPLCGNAYKVSVTGFAL